MKKYILRFFLTMIFVLTILFGKNVVYGKDVSIPWSLCKIIYGKSESAKEAEVKMVNKINEYCSGEKVTSLEKTPLIIKTKVTLEGNDAFSPEGRKVKIGNIYVGSEEQMEHDGVTETVTQNDGLTVANNNEKFRLDFDKVTNYLGFEGTVEEFMDTQKEISWDIIIIADVPNWEAITDGDYERTYDITVKRVLSGEDMSKVTDTEQEESEIPNNKMEEKKEEEDESSYWDFILHPIKSTINILLDLARAIFGDAPQMLANTAQLGFTNWKIMYDYDSFPTKLNTFVDLTNSTETLNQRKITIEDKKQKVGSDEVESYNFSRKTKIPVIAVDIYTMAVNKVDMVKANFFGKTGEEIGIWQFIRDFCVSVIHVAMYVVIALLILGLIVDGIQLLSQTILSPKERKQKIKNMQKFAIGVIMLFGTLFIEALSIHLSEMILGSAGIDETYEGPLIVEVKDKSNETIYSFSTTPTGYVRYMSEMKNLDLYQEKAVYVVEYILLAWSNLIILMAMMVRMLIMMLLSVVGFIIVLKNVMSSQENGFSGYKKWIKAYVTIAIAQFFLALLARFVLENTTLLK